MDAYRSFVAAGADSSPQHISPLHSGREASVNVSGPHAAKAARRAIAKLFSATSGHGGEESPATCAATVMLTQDERDAAKTWRARAAAELRSIREDGLLGRNWRKHPRTIFLLGYLSGTSHRLELDNAARN
jgi:hypothetical protein